MGAGDDGDEPARPTRDARARAPGRAGSSGRERGSRPRSRRTSDRRLPSEEGRLPPRRKEKTLPSSSPRARSPGRSVATDVTDFPPAPGSGNHLDGSARREVDDLEAAVRSHNGGEVREVLVRDPVEREAPVDQRRGGVEESLGIPEQGKRLRDDQHEDQDEARDHQPAATRDEDGRRPVREPREEALGLLAHRVRAARRQGPAPPGSCVSSVWRSLRRRPSPCSGKKPSLTTISWPFLREHEEEELASRAGRAASRGPC